MSLSILIDLPVMNAARMGGGGGGRIFFEHTISVKISVNSMAFFIYSRIN